MSRGSTGRVSSKTSLPTARARSWTKVVPRIHALWSASTRISNFSLSVNIVLPHGSAGSPDPLQQDAPLFFQDDAEEDQADAADQKHEAGLCHGAEKLQIDGHNFEGDEGDTEVQHENGTLLNSHLDLDKREYKKSDCEDPVVAADLTFVSGTSRQEIQRPSHERQHAHEGQGPCPAPLPSQIAQVGHAGQKEHERENAKSRKDPR